MSGHCQPGQPPSLSTSVSFLGPASERASEAALNRRRNSSNICGEESRGDTHDSFLTRDSSDRLSRLEINSGSVRGEFCGICAINLISFSGPHILQGDLSDTSLLTKYLICYMLGDHLTFYYLLKDAVRRMKEFNAFFEAGFAKFYMSRGPSTICGPVLASV